MPSWPRTLQSPLTAFQTNQKRPSHTLETFVSRPCTVVAPVATLGEHLEITPVILPTRIPLLATAPMEATDLWRLGL